MVRYAERGTPISAIPTVNGSEFCRSETHPFELYLAFNDVEHRRTQVRSPQTIGFVERFHGTIQVEFFQVALRQRFYASAEDLQPDLDVWLATTTLNTSIAAIATVVSVRWIRPTTT